VIRLLTLGGTTAFTFYAIIVVAMFFGQRALIYPVPDGIAPLPAGYEQVMLKTEDGLNIKAAWRAPQEGRPTAVYFHGNSGSWNDASDATALLAEAGYGVLLPEYRGYGGNPGSPSEEGLYADGRASLNWLAERGIAPTEQIVIGQSLGTGVATRMASEFESRALVLFSPYTSVPAAGATHYPWLPVDSLAKDRFASIDIIGDITVPVLVLHGTADRVIPHELGETLAKAAPHGEFMSFPGEGHFLAFHEAGMVAAFDWLEALQE
jgi:fermentation-respiration switch protein FrsA (DUF1100 family)